MLSAFLFWKRQEIYACYVLEKASICRGFGKDYPISILLAQLFHLDNFVVKKRAALFGSVGKFQVRTLQSCYLTKEVE